MRFIAGDPGGSVVVDSPIARGDRTAVDFDHVYGLFPLLLGRALYTPAGRGPAESTAACMACGALAAFRCARFAAALRVVEAGVALSMLGLVYSAQPLVQGLPLSLLLTLAAAFGPRSVLATASPLGGARIYATQHFGFFRGIGRNFVLPSRARPGYCVGTAAGFWLAGTGALLAGARGVLCNLDRRRQVLVATCAGLHVAFVSLIFGDAWSWTYNFLLPLGLAAPSIRGRAGALVAAGLVEVAPAGRKSTFQVVAAGWRLNARSPETAGMWAMAEERAPSVIVVGPLKGGAPYRADPNPSGPSTAPSPPVNAAGSASKQPA